MSETDPPSNNLISTNSCYELRIRKDNQRMKLFRRIGLYFSIIRKTGRNLLSDLLFCVKVVLPVNTIALPKENRKVNVTPYNGAVELLIT